MLKNNKKGVSKHQIPSKTLKDRNSCFDLIGNSLARIKIGKIYQTNAFYLQKQT
jgi:hypothetical protein